MKPNEIAAALVGIPAPLARRFARACQALGIDAELALGLAVQRAVIEAAAELEAAARRRGRKRR